MEILQDFSFGWQTVYDYIAGMEIGDVW